MYHANEHAEVIDIKKEKKARPIDLAIEKWVNIAFKEGTDEGPTNCPLCAKFFDDQCADCPVQEYTGYEGCRDSPYAEWEDHQYEEHEGKEHRKVHCEVCQRLAVEEIAFLMRVREEA